MRTVDTHLLDEKIEEAMKHFINSQQQNEPVHMDASNLSLNVQDDTGSRVVTVMHPPSFSSQLCRQVGEAVPPNDSSTWGEEILDAEGKLAALVAHLSQNPRAPHLHHKVPPLRTDVDTTVISDAAMRLFNGQTLEQQNEPMVVQQPLPPLPPLQEMKQRCQDDWFMHKQTKRILVKEDQEMLSDAERSLEMAGASPAQHKHSKKSLPHKKRISRKLKRNTGNCTPQQDLVVINCPDEMHQEEILPDNYVTSTPHQSHLPEAAHHIAHDVRPIFICQICGEFYGEDQLKFYHHLKHHYESQATIIIENPVPDLGIDKMTNTCIVDSVPALPDSLVELSLENSLPTKSAIYHQSLEKHILYSSSEKIMSYTNNKVLYSMATMEKAQVAHSEPVKELYDTISKQDSYSCTRCSKSFKKQKHCELHIKEVHNKSMHDMNEFSEPEDLMEGIYVMVDGEEHAESGSSSNYAEHFLPHLTVDNGHVHQEHSKQWYLRNSGPNAECSTDGAYCPVCPPVLPPRETSSPVHLKEEVLQRIFEVEVGTTETQSFADNMAIAETEDVHPDTEDSHQGEAEKPPDEERHLVMGDEATGEDEDDDDKKKIRKFACPQCPRVLNHRNSLLYHLLSHGGRRPHECTECSKAFYTAGALKIHVRVHNGDKPYKCTECGRDFRQWGDLKYHMISLHTPQKQYKCEFCSKEFARKYSLSIHRRIHTGERNYKCYYCNKSFRASSYRLSHMRTHTGEKPHKCEECGKSFRAGGDLRRHLLMHDKARARLHGDKPRAKLDHAVKPEKSEVTQLGPRPSDIQIPADISVSPVDAQTSPTPKNPPSSKRCATMSTAKSSMAKTSPTGKKPAKSRSKKSKKPAPNVTITKSKQVPEQFEGMKLEYSHSVNGQCDKFKDTYPNIVNDKAAVNDPHKLKNYAEHLDHYAKSENGPNYATLRTMFRPPICTIDNVKGSYEKAENTDGKGISVFTLVERPNVSIITHNNELRSHIDGKRTEINSEDPSFIERLTALYNIAQV